jgi:hypothetical protein
MVYPKKSGVYSWYSDVEGLNLLGIDKSKCVEKNGRYLIYIGKDNNSLKNRLRWHMDSSYGSNQKVRESDKFMLSTLRHSLGSLLFEENKGEELDMFMTQHLIVEYIVTNSKEETIRLEDEMILNTSYLPLNLRGNRNRDDFHTLLSQKRKSFKINTIKSLEL